MENILKHAKSELWQYFRETTVHGFRYVATSGQIPVKIFWASVIVAGFTCTYNICEDVLSDWERDPFFTTISSGRVTEVQFPTVTVCQDPDTAVDKWAAVRKIANNVPFDCRHCDEETLHCAYVGPCADADKIELVRNNLATKAILENLSQYVSRQVGLAQGLPAEEEMPKDIEEKYSPLIPWLLRLDGDEAAMSDVTKRTFVRAESWTDVIGAIDCEDCSNCGDYYCNYTVDEINNARDVATRLNFLIPRHKLGFGSFLERLAELIFVGDDRTWCHEAKRKSNQFSTTVQFQASDLHPDDAMLHKYFGELAEAAGFSGGFSLLDVPAVFAAITEKDYNTKHFTQITCANERDIGQDCEKKRVWHKFLFAENGTESEHPCEATDFCNYWPDLLLGYNSLTTLTKILKISSHLGHWRTYSFGTEDFPALSEADRALADENEYVEYVHGPHGGGHQHNYNQENEGCLKDLKDMLGGDEERTGQLPRDIENSYVLYEEVNMPFQPMVTDKGICLAANAEPLKNLLKKDHPYAGTFEEAFESETKSTTVAKNNGTGHFYDLQFYAVNHFSLNTLHDDTRVFFGVALNWHKNAFNIRSSQIQVRAGYHTIIRVLAPQLSHISENVERMDEKSRDCRLTSESQDMELFKDYTEAGCRFECMLRYSAEKCRCIPWNYPNPIGNVNKTCDQYSAHCFETAMSRQNDVDIDCECPDDCHGLRFAYSVQQVPTDSETVCRDPKNPFYRLLKYQGGAGSFPNSFLMDATAFLHGESQPHYDNGRYVLDEMDEIDLAAFSAATCWKMFRRAGAIISVQVDSDVYTRVGKSRKWSFGAMVGTIGGNLGLFTGMSIISIVEIVFWMGRGLLNFSAKAKGENGGRTGRRMTSVS